MLSLRDQSVYESGTVAWTALEDVAAWLEYKDTDEYFSAIKSGEVTRRLTELWGE